MSSSTEYNIKFSVNLYDEQGKKWEDCILLHMGNGSIIQFGDLKAYDSFLDKLQKMREEIKLSI